MNKFYLIAHRSNNTGTAAGYADQIQARAVRVLARNRPGAMSALQPLSGGKRTHCGHIATAVFDPIRTLVPRTAMTKNAVEPAYSSHPLIVPIPSTSVQYDMSRSGLAGH